ncbi:hypothetical protein [Sulfurospirillum sp. 1612]|uniref:hypothetical protein n=1 Tax=Sulfurospirillum sp. 1612 TaxID=3094835 RepID=UPI002F95E13A
MESKLNLNAGDTLKQTEHKMKGPMQETDIWTYEILNQDGEVVGSVIHKDHTAIKGFRRTQSVEQKDSSGNVIVSTSW